MSKLYFTLKDFLNCFLTEAVYFSSQVLVSMVTTTLSLYTKLTAVLKSRTPHCVEVLKHSVSLLLIAVTQLKAHFPSGGKGEFIKTAFLSLKESLWKWIVHPDVIGGSVFGGSLPVYTSSMGMWKRKEELKLWQSLLTLECPFDQQVTKEWHKIASAHIQKRIDAVSAHSCCFCLIVNIYVFEQIWTGP